MLLEWAAPIIGVEPKLVTLIIAQDVAGHSKRS